MLIAAVASVALAGVAASAIGGQWAPHTQSEMNLAGALSYPASLTVQLLSGLTLVASAIAFIAYAERSDRNAGLLAGAALLLAGSMLQFLALPALAAAWVTPATGMRLAAYALLLLVALRRDARLRKIAELEAIGAERQRIARDLHDGLAQDLAVIAAHGQHLVAELGAEHPLVLAAQRSLAASRGAIIDLAASAAPTTGAALREVADELERRFGVQIRVRVTTAARSRNDLDRLEREQVVRIAREAIVNAVCHGGARNIDVELDYRGPDLLRVTDDGCGIAADAAGSCSGFGLPMMRARAESIGGCLVARPAPQGGTELEVLIR
jgi:signal transduction histidine kinase